MHTHTFTRERESANSTDDHDSAPHINRSVNSTHGHESAPTSTSPLLDARPPTQTEITHSHTDTRDAHTHLHMRESANRRTTMNPRRDHTVRNSTHGHHHAPRSRMHTVRNSMRGRHRAPRSHIHTHSPSPQLDARPPPHVEITPHKSTHGRDSAHTTHRRIRRTTARPPTMRLARVVCDATRVWSRRAPPASSDPLVGPPQ